MINVFGIFISALLTIVKPYAIDHRVALDPINTACLTEAIYYEARGEQLDGANVAYVILNRVKQSGKQICNIVHNPHTFSYYSTHLPPIKEIEAWKLSAYIAVYTQLNLLPNQIGNATAYNERPVNAWLKDYVYTHKVGQLYFYRSRTQPELLETELIPVTTTSSVQRVVSCNTLAASRTGVSVTAETTITLFAKIPFPSSTELTCEHVQAITKAFAAVNKHTPNSIERGLYVYSAQAEHRAVTKSIRHTKRTIIFHNKYAEK